MLISFVVSAYLLNLKLNASSTIISAHFQFNPIVFASGSSSLLETETCFRAFFRISDFNWKILSLFPQNFYSFLFQHLRIVWFCGCFLFPFRFPLYKSAAKNFLCLILFARNNIVESCSAVAGVAVVFISLS